jgi:hypothetical protein
MAKEEKKPEKMCPKCKRPLSKCSCKDKGGDKKK